MSTLSEAEGRDEAGEDDPILIEWAAELAVRIRGGESVDLEEFASRHPERAQALERMLPAFELMARMADPMNRAVARRDPIPDPMAELGCLGDYRLLREIGRGGMGVVYEGQQFSLKRRVALKILPCASAMNARQVQRFQIEAQAAASLHHTNIVPVYTVGTERGVPFYAMQFIDGRSLAEVIRELRQLDGLEAPGPAAACAFTRSLTAGYFGPTPEKQNWADYEEPERETTSSEPAGPKPISAESSARCRGFIRTVAALGLQAAEALEHAHQQGILHRDIKPSNLLVDEAGHLWVTDFGLARLPGESNLTLTGDVMGTLRYMSPEQALGKRLTLDGKSDVYSLGATLYELLTLRPAFGGDDRQEVLRRIAQEEPRPPRRLNRAIPAPFETIVLKAMSKEPGRRYATAAALRDDLQRFLDDRPILGRPVSAWSRALSWARRRPAAAALIALVGLTACGLVGGIAAWISWLGWHNRQLEIQIARADQQTQAAENQHRIADHQRRLADRHRGAASLRRAREALEARQFELAQDILHDFGTESDKRGDHGFAWGYFWRQANRDFTQLWGHEATVSELAVSQDGKTLATYGVQEKNLVWDVAPDMKIDKPRAAFSSSVENGIQVQWFIFSPDGRYAAKLRWGPQIAAIDLFDTTSGRVVNRLEGEVSENPQGLGFDPEGRRLVLVVKRLDGTLLIRWWHVADQNHDPHSWVIEKGASFLDQPQPTRFLVVNRDNRTRLFDPWNGEVQVVLAEPGPTPPAPGRPFAWSADGRFIVAHTQPNLIRFWDTLSGSEIGRFQVPTLSEMAMSRKGSRLAAMDEWGAVTIFDRELRQQRVLVSRLEKHGLRVCSMSFSSDESLLAASVVMVGGGPPSVEVWDVATFTRRSVFPGRQDIERLAFIPGTHSVILAGGTKPRIWRLDPPREPDALERHGDETWAAAFSPDGKVLAIGSDDTDEPETIKLWDPASGRRLGGWKAHTATVVSLAFSPDGKSLASSSLDSGKPGDANALVWDFASQKSIANLTGHVGRVRSVAFSPDGKLLATAGEDGLIRFWNTADYSSHATLSGHSNRVMSIAFSPDGQVLASAACDATVRLWDVSNAAPRAVLHDDGNVNAVAFSPDGSLVASANDHGRIKLWDIKAIDPILSIPSSAKELWCLAFTRDGRHVAASGTDKVIRLWDITTSQEVLSLTGHQDRVNTLAFSPDGLLLVSCSHDNAVKLWRADPVDVVPRR
jgi:eukaryotic-like serine/threonine-protein kinase